MKQARLTFKGATSLCGLKARDSDRYDRIVAIYGPTALSAII